jgi:glycosyltransferase involved in cell wall biosynthesis
MIPYGADLVASASPELLRPFGLEPDGYALVVARPEPDNSILEIVQAFCAKPRHIRLVVLGKYSPATNSYHRRVLAAATNETIFPGAIYDIDTVAALRFHARLYIHGHKVGGTNPSLVEALGAGTPVLAHDNPFNRWVAGEAGRYFRGRIQLDALLTAILDDASTLNALKLAARARHQNSFQWDIILQQYEKLLTRHLN